MNPDLVKEALRDAMMTTRKEWSADFCDWLIDLVDISLRSSIGCYENQWYAQKNGVPTGGSLCVQLANIAVYYIMHKCVYSNNKLMKRVHTVKRYIDDGAGFFSSTERKFNQWIADINKSLKDHGLLIDESVWKNVGEFVAFLDIKYCFDSNGNLQTDLHVKETDSRSYLHFSSAHPNHIYSGIVYSQCIRLRRIINSQERLKVRLEELCEAFKAAAYPSKMVENISKKVLNSERSLERKEPIEESTADPLPIRIVSTFGSDTDIVTTVKKYEEDLKKTRSFSDLSSQVSSTSSEEPRQGKQLFQFVKKLEVTSKAASSK